MIMIMAADDDNCRLCLYFKVPHLKAPAQRAEGQTVASQIGLSVISDRNVILCG